MPSLAPNSKRPCTLYLSTGTSATPDAVPRIEPTNSFHTLGVYLFPSGSQKHQIKILRLHAQDYYASVSTSSLTPSEAYWSFILFLCPKLVYPLPCCTLTLSQCQFIQAPILAALLPKLHLNRHSSCAVLLSSPYYGGFAIPDYYIDQGFGQLCLLIGHLKLQDENDQLIRILLLYLHLHLGSSTPIFQLSFKQYEKWIEGNWITSLWEFLSKASMTLDIEHHWTPTPARTHDCLLMDSALLQSLHLTQLKHINSCRLYLQV